MQIAKNLTVEQPAKSLYLASWATVIFTAERQIEQQVMCQKTRSLLLQIDSHPEEHRKSRQEQSKLKRQPREVPKRGALR